MLRKGESFELRFCFNLELIPTFDSSPVFFGGVGRIQCEAMAKTGIKSPIIIPMCYSEQPRLRLPTDRTPWHLTLEMSMKKYSIYLTTRSQISFRLPGKECPQPSHPVLLGPVGIYNFPLDKGYAKSEIPGPRFLALVQQNSRNASQVTGRQYQPCKSCCNKH